MFRKLKKTIKRTSIYRNWLIEKQRRKSDKAPFFDRGDFDNLKGIIIYLGNGRSGHSVHGRLLDAHNKIILADEVHYLKYINNNFTKKQIFNQTVLVEQYQGIKKSKGSTFLKKFTYDIPDQWLGRYENPLYIGTSKAPDTTLALKRLEEKTNFLEDFFELPVKYFHCKRNPLDNISTLAIATFHPDISKQIEHYFKIESYVEEIKQSIPITNFHSYNHEDLIDNPVETLRKAIEFLDLEYSEKYLNDCASIIFKTKSLSRDKIKWSEKELHRVQELALKFGISLN